MDKSAIICQARIGSSRLPGKVLYSISGMNALETIASRHRASDIDIPLIFAISDKKADQALAYECERLDLDYVIGDENNLIDRYLRAADRFGLERIIRITSDCPLFDFSDLARRLDRLEIRSTLTTNSHEFAGRAPDGFDFEVFETHGLRSLLLEGQLRTDHCEHVTTFWREFNQADCHLITDYPREYENLRFTLDSPEDFLLLSKLTSLLSSSELENIDIDRLCEMCVENGLYEINQHLIRPIAISPPMQGFDS